MSYRNIVVAVALQRYVIAPPLAERQREIGLALAQASGARLSVVTVEAPIALAPSAESIDEKLRAYAAPLVEAGAAVDTDVLRGRPGLLLPPYVQEVGADLVIVGSHSRRGFLEITLGNTAAQLLRDLAPPVLLVRPTAEDLEAARGLMIPHYPQVFPYV